MTDHIPATHPEHSYKHGHEQEVNSFDESREALKLLSKMHIIILGIPGAGKTTLCEALETQNDDINYISLGEISRNLPPESQERQELNRLFELGSPLGIPEFFCGLVEPYIDEAIDQDRGFILDGIPKKSEEILPLQQMLASKGIEIDLVVSCEISPLVAYDRVGNRSSRDGDEDTMEIFANRTAKYLQDIDTFKKQLGSDNNVPIIAINTAESSVEHATTRLIEYAQNIIKNNKQEVGERERSIQLYEAVKNNDIRTIISLIGSQFDDELPSFPHATLYENNLDEIQKHEIVADVLALKDPDLLLTPLFLKRLSKNYVNTTLMSIEHLATSLVEEVKNRYGDDFSSENVQEIMAQQLNLKRLIESLQNELVGQKNFSHHIEEEVNRNSTELEHITDIFRKHAQDLGIDIRGYDAAYFMKLQPQLWGQLTSNRVISAPDFNYRRTSNGVPGSHHSLLPFTKNNRSLSATSMGEYVPFIEAVSSTEYEYTSTFGFIHLIGKDESGEAYGVEYPIMMHDQRLLSLNSEIINEVLSTVDSFYSNHDLWHNMIPVYSDHFILHHAHAPLSYGGRMPAYVDFGKKMRQDKEEYEISVAMAHARTQQERYSADPSYRDQQTNLLRTALQRIPQLKTELADTCSQDEIQNITDYLTFMTVRRAYNVLPSTDPIFEEIDTILDSIEGLSKV
ncbi:nucleoside monophosphate kinase, partial [Candidatus Saccharibacteria bacterium]|nr:nucleoside monophosphate kinase [Candidatus Saccharibacteria bacterium]